MIVSKRVFAAILLALSVAACGGSGTFPAGSVVNSPGGGGAPPTKIVNVKVTVTIGAASKAKIRPNYISVNTESLVIGLSSVNGKGVTGVNPTIVNTLPKSHNCKAQGSQTVCTATASGSPGQDVFAVTTYSGTNATGSVLSVGTVQVKIGSSPDVKISNQLSLTLDGVIASIELSVSPDKGKLGTPVQAVVSLAAYDASGAQIVGPSDYGATISLGIQGDTGNAFLLHDGTKSRTAFTIAKPTSNIALTYDGNKQASSITLAATVNGQGSIAKTANFTLHGHVGPPPVGTIYVLNLGKHNGAGAVVTEYDGTASGNAAPANTLTLDPKLYARSIALDSQGDLYVGYLYYAYDSYGIDAGTGVPYPQNEVAVYAPGASGNAQPIRVINSDPSPSSVAELYPIFTAIDPSGRLVTYGSTNVDRNNDAVGAVLTYAAGSSGQVAPEYGFNFASPFIKYNAGATPTGLAIDPSNNFYVNGKLEAPPALDYGLYVAPAKDIGTPDSAASRTILWNSTSELAAGFTNNVALDKGGEIYIGNSVTSGSGNGATCQARVNAFSAGSGSGSKGDAPLRILTLSGMSFSYASSPCYSSPLYPYFPTIEIYDTTLVAVDVINDTVGLFDATANGTVKPSVQIAGSATQLDEPVALALSPPSGRAKARPAHPR